MKIALLTLLVIALAWLGYAGLVEPNWLDVHMIEVEIRDLPPELEGFTILHISDLHQRNFAPGQKRLEQAFSQYDYHMVAFTGDVITNSRTADFAPAEALLGLFDKPVFFVPGNHDYPLLTQIRELMEQHGAHMMENTYYVLEHNGASLAVAGVHDPYHARYSYEMYQPDLAAALPPENMFVILLAHSPGIMEEATNASIPLVLVGHTHGGQIKIPLLGAPTTASGTFFDQYVQGLYVNGHTQMYINRGLGTTGLPLRFLSRPEVVFIRLIGK